MKSPRVDTGFVANRLGFVFTAVLNLTVYAAVAILFVYGCWVIMAGEGGDPGLYRTVGKVANGALVLMICIIPAALLIRVAVALWGWLSDD